MGRIDRDPSADDDQAITDTKNDLGHGLLTTQCNGLAGVVVVDCRIVGHEPLIFAVSPDRNIGDQLQ